MKTKKRVRRSINLNVMGGSQALQVAIASGKLPSSKKESIRRLEKYLKQAKEGKTTKVLIAFPCTTTKAEIREINKALKKRGSMLAFMWDEPLKFKWDK